MSALTIADPAVRDLAGLWADIADARDERTASVIHQKILEGCRARASFPQTGRSRDDIHPGLRSFPVKPYVVFFRQQGDGIVVLRVLHGRMDVDSIMKRN